MTRAVSRVDWAADNLPLVVFPVGTHASPSERADSLRACADRYLPRVGSMLFRGFGVFGEGELHRFAAAFGGGAVLVREGWERAASGRLWVACTGAAEVCTETRIADNREIRAMLSSATLTRLFERGLRDRDFGPLLQGATLEPALSPSGSSITAEALAEIVSAYAACATRVDWEAGDVLLVDRERTTVCVPAPERRELRFASTVPTRFA